MRAARTVFAVSICVIAVLAVGVVGAVACNEPVISLNHTGASKGEPVGWDIGPTTSGAQYEVYVDGTSVASGSSPGGNVHGTFTMPDFGAADKTVTVKAIVTHNDIQGPESNSTGTYPSEATITYTAPAAEPSPSPAAQQPASGPVAPAESTEAPAPDPQAAGQPAERTVSAPHGDAPATRPSHVKTALPVASHRTRQISGAGRHVRRGSPVQSEISAAANPVATTQAWPASSARSAPLSVRERARTHAPTADQRQRRDARPPAQAAAGVERADSPGGSRRVNSPVGATGTVLVLLGGLAAALLWVRQRRRGVRIAASPMPSTEPPLVSQAHEAKIEAELQEIIAEEKARQARPASRVT
jgi:hypothetical protein